MEKYVFTDKNYNPICIAYYADDNKATIESDKLSKEMNQIVYVCRHISQYIFDTEST